MRQYDVFPYSEGNPRAPFVVILQHDSVDDRDTTIVAPCIERRIGPANQRLTPEVLIGGRSYVVVTSELASMKRSRLKARPVENLSAHRDAFTRAIDLLFTGV